MKWLIYYLCFETTPETYTENYSLEFSILYFKINIGQITASLIFDQDGWLGYPKIELSYNRILGALLIIFGVLLVTKE